MRRRDRRGGYILVAVLAVAVILTGIVAAGSLVIRSVLGTARVADAAVASAGLLSTGVEVAAYQLAVLRIAPALVDGRSIRLTDGTVTAHVTDEGGKVDLNAANPKLLAGVLAGIGMDEGAVATVVQRIVALRGPANGVIADGGTAPGPAASGPATLPAGGGPILGIAAPAPTGLGSPAPSAQGNAPRKRRGLRSVDDLSDIEGVRRGDMPQLRQRLTGYNPDGRINVMTASPAVLLSMPGMTELKLTQVLAARDAGPDGASAAQAALGGDLASFIKALPGPAYTVRISAIDKGGRERSVEAVVAASKSPAQPYYILSWLE